LALVITEEIVEVVQVPQVLTLPRHLVDHTLEDKSYTWNRVDVESFL